ncbi:MAG: UDP-N-acetylglucosamine 2-epimerase (non-hydrolyzing) [Ezakiella sp.]|nr:UDP-N-acetylglucosamine 2-epimerase (non-hydrolyzing) [Ezakiella sp.]MDD7472434.1 UDP-N-acetylglucosamine 2-epimerase (non-hydrolyzing) [Bacillota bacterium]
MKVVMIIGTRPEIIKCFPVIKKMRENELFDLTVVFTGQHRELLDMMIEDLKVENFTNLRIFETGQRLSGITSNALSALESLEDKDFDYCIVQGDTTTVFAGALWAFYNGIKVCHIEAGLRSGNIYSPFPEEANRKMVSTISSLNFAPTARARENLLAEGIKDDTIFVTGNTVIDSLRLSKKDNYSFQNEELNKLFGKRVVLLTCHRRENQSHLDDIFGAVRDAIKNQDIELVFPMHFTPKVREYAQKYFGELENATLIEPLSYHDMVHLLSKVDFVVTDSGGLQEEAPGFGKPVLVIRQETERPEAIEAGTCKLSGTKYEDIKKDILELLSKGEMYKNMSHAKNPFGDGYAADKILDIMVEDYNKEYRA